VEEGDRGGCGRNNIWGWGVGEKKNGGPTTLLHSWKGWMNERKKKKKKLAWLPSGV